MEVLHQRCAGLDVHKDNVVACVRIAVNAEVEHEVRTFSTTTRGLLELSDWLHQSGCTHVAMEATGVYWKPVWHILDGSFELLLCNARHVRNVPGRKSDVNDATWLADLLAHGLVRASFVPPRAVQQLRDLTRTRKQLVREVSQHTSRMLKVLEDANIKLASFISDILGKSGRAILDAIVAGESDPEALLALAGPKLKASREDLRESLRGTVTEHHRFLLGHHLRLIDALQQTISEIDARIGGALDPFRESAERLTSIPGVSDIAADVIIAEIGLDMRRFATAGHLISWAGLCPRMDESAGKHRSTRVREGAPWLKSVLVQCAWAASRKKNSYLQAQFRRLKSRRGPKKAAVAVAASILTAAYYMLRDGTSYQDLGGDHFDRRNNTKVATRMVRRLKELGYEVELRAAA